MSGLPWVRLDSTLPTNPKVLQLLAMREGHRTAFVHCAALAYCGQHGTDGVVATFALPAVHGRPVDAARLVEVGLWHAPGHECLDCPQPAKDAWVVHDFLEHQQARMTTEAIRAARREGANKGNCLRWHGEDCGCWKRNGLRGLG